METHNLPRSARIARDILKVIVVPLCFLAVISRFTVPDWYWIDIALVGLFPLAVVLAIVGRITLKA
jgi:hypothetical protein